MNTSLLAETKTWSVTGFPALLIILAVLAVLIGIGVLIGRKMSRNRRNAGR